MKITRAERWAALAALAVLIFTLGFFAGRSARGGGFVIETALSGNQAPTVSLSETAATEAVSEPLQAKVNINTADAAELATLPGIGEVLADRIIDYREAYGAFVIIEQITDVPGIGEKLLESIRAFITVGEEDSA